MKILVCVSKTPETTSKIEFTNNNTKFNTAGVSYIMNPYDEWYALVRAVELKEQFEGSKVTMIAVGDASYDPVIRKGLAIGADQALRIDAEPTSALFVAKQIAKYAKGFDVILLGKETIDYNGGELGAMLAELLDLPFISFASDMKVEGNTATIAREIEGGKEIVKLQIPFVVSAAKGLAEQRIPNMKGIMAAKTKPLAVRPAAEVAEHVKTIRYETPPAKKGCIYVDPNNMDELVRLLHENAKVI
jgi:electron transfer flavoprotein beta subunit